jgi:hypothetical protein
MARLGIVLLALACFLPAAERKRKEPPYRGPEVEILEAKAFRTEGMVKIDVRVKNCGVRPIEGLVLLFDFMAPGKAVITTQKIEADEEVLEPGEQSLFLVQLNDPVRAVHFQLQAIDSSARDLRVAKPGPYHIE